MANRSTFEELQVELDILQEQEDLIKINQTRRRIKAEQAKVAGPFGTQHRPYDLESDPEPKFEVLGLKLESGTPDMEQGLADTMRVALPQERLPPPARGNGTGVPENQPKRARRKQPATRRRRHVVVDDDDSDEYEQTPSRNGKKAYRKDPKKRALSTRFGPINDDPAYASVVRMDDGSYAELECPYCHGNAASKGDNVKSDFFRGAAGVLGHVIHCHADQFENPFRIDRVMQQGVRRQLSRKEVKAVKNKDHNSYQVRVVIAAKKPLIDRSQAVAPMEEQQTEGEDDVDPNAEGKRSNPQSSLGMMSRNTAPGGPARPFFST